MRTIGVTLALLLAMVSAAAVQRSSFSPSTCSQSEVTRTGALVDESRAHLLALPVADMDTEVSAAAQQTIAEMKNSLDGFIQAYMRCIGHQPDAHAMKADLSSKTHARQVSRDQPRSEPPANSEKYGSELSFEVRVFENPRLIGVTAEFAIQCGGDAMLLLFAPDHDSWKEELRWQKKPYDTVAGGTLAFHYDVSPPDDAGQWFVVTHDIAPWCSSTWSTIRYSVLRPDAAPAHPKVQFSASDEIWWGSDDVGSLTVQKDAFDLRFHSWSIDPGIHNRVWIRHYVITNDDVRRTQPVAVTPRDFVDEWVVSPWIQAEKWSARSALPRLRQAHAEWARKSKLTDSLIEYGSVRRCSDRRDHYQVELGELSVPKLDRYRSFFFHVLGDRDYTMLRVSEEPDTRCRGRDLLDDMKTK